MNDDEWSEVAPPSTSPVSLRSPCRSGDGARKHHCSESHARLVLGYRDAREAYELRREAVTVGYATETRAYNRDVGTLTFRDWLRSSRGSAVAA